MYANRQIKIITVTSGILALLCGVAVAQTIDEVSELQRKATMSKIKRESGMSEPGPVSPQMLRQAKSEAKPVFVPPNFAVVSIGGSSPTTLTATIAETGARNLRLRVGEQTRSGWTVARITPQSVYLSKEMSAKEVADEKSESLVAKSASNKKASSKTVPKEADALAVTPEKQYRRLVVHWGDNLRIRAAQEAINTRAALGLPANSSAPIVGMNIPINALTATAGGIPLVPSLVPIGPNTR
ncbi:MAG: hypothetical protein RLY95_26 [Pseudomonadota bacterium]|jgi:hypothetical protein